MFPLVAYTILAWQYCLLASSSQIFLLCILEVDIVLAGDIFSYFSYFFLINLFHFYFFNTINYFMLSPGEQEDSLGGFLSSEYFMGIRWVQESLITGCFHW